MRKLAAIVFFVLIITGCAIGGDAAFRVEGTLMGRDSASPKCVLHMRNVGTERSVDFRDISTSFNAEFIVPAGKRPYFFLVECPDGTRYRSTTYELGGNTTLGSKLVLGELQPTK